MKGFLVQANSHVRRTHDLDALAAIVMVHFPSIEHLLKPMRDWTSWSVAYRYPGEAGPEPEPAVVELSEALEVITHLDTALRELAPRNADGA